MKNKIKNLGLSGILLGVTISPCFSQKNQDKEYISNTINNVQYTDKTWNNKFNLEEQFLLGKYNLKDIPVILAKNNDFEKGELEFIVYPENECEIQNIYGRGIALVGNKYIPTRLVTKNHERIKNFELNEINAKIIKEIKKSKIKSQNSYGFSIDLSEKDLKSKLPQITLPNGKNYLCLDVDWGNFYTDNGNIHKIDLNGKLSKFFVPITNGYVEGIDMGNGKIYLHSEEGFYIPVIEEQQIILEEFERTKNEDKNTNYMKYLEEKRNLEFDSEKAPGKNYYIIKKGDNLKKISEFFYGSEKEIERIYELNPEIDKKTNLILPGQKIRIR